MTAFARAMGLAAQHAWLDALDASRVDAYDARVWPTYPDSGPEDLFERASLAARSARRVYSHIGEKARAAGALAALAEISFCEASVLPRRMFTRLGQSSGASGVMEDLPRLGVAGHGSAIERFRRALREFDDIERLAANDEDADARGSAESARARDVGGDGEERFGKNAVRVDSIRAMVGHVRDGSPSGGASRGRTSRDVGYPPRGARVDRPGPRHVQTRARRATSAREKRARRLDLGFEGDDAGEDEDEEVNEHAEEFDIEAQMRVDDADDGESEEEDEEEDMEPTIVGRARRWFRRMRAP